MASHTMKLQPVPFEQILAGIKTIELRLNDTKRQAVKPGDTLVFLKEPDLVQSVTTLVIERLEYPTFMALVQANPPLSMGFEQGIEGYVRPDYYSVEDEQRYGALGLRVEKVETI